MEQKHTLVVGGSIKPERFANKAIRKLLDFGHTVSSIGLREGWVEGVKIQTGRPFLENVHTISLYINPKHQAAYYDYLTDLKPKRVVFNPGTENREFERLLANQGIDVTIHCTLVMLSEGSY